MPSYASTRLLNRLTADLSDINLQVKNGVYPIQLAAESGAFTALKWLLDKGADANVQDYVKSTVLHVAATSCSPASVEILEYLIQRDHDVAAQDVTGRTPLHNVLYYYDTRRGIHISGIALANAKCLLKNGADVNAQDKEGNTPLHLAAARNHKGIVGLLSRAGAQTFKTDNRGLTAIEMAPDEEIREMIELYDLGV
ncbi:ankyrin repeat-containing domain protein [Annulohypoxylon bovei var. microspora]|nr:ankyrin repeat-containing domain protein [Annulohypoxylon bovei var. microspora]